MKYGLKHASYNFPEVKNLPVVEQGGVKPTLVALRMAAKTRKALQHYAARIRSAWAGAGAVC